MAPTTGKRCLGLTARLCGQKRSPLPPAMITIKRCDMRLIWGGPRTQCNFHLRLRDIGSSSVLKPAMTENYPLELSVEETKRLLDTQPDRVTLIDVREPHELDICRIPGSEAIPMRQIPEHVGTLPKDKHLLIHCHHGGRSLRVTQYLRANGYEAVTNVAGGIDAWSLAIDPTVPRY